MRPKTWQAKFLLAALLGVLAAAQPGALIDMQEKQEKPVGYNNTPFLPDGRWRVHDSKRPAPRSVTPAPAISAGPPSDAVVLFDGKDLSSWTGRRGKAGWKVVDGFMEINATGDIRTREHFGDMQLHLEWATPTKVKGSSQGRSNSGVFLMGVYEVQVLDSYMNRTYSDGQAAALYGQCPPMVNASRKPGEWQTYDIFFRAPVFAGQKLVKPAMVTVVHNGVIVHHGQEFIGSTTHKRVGAYKAHGAKGPIRIQDHGDPVRFRNIWVRPL